jgi:2-dehydro-3-deoxyphosphooctonate aldolase (KDO 8-P synthase)
MTQSSSTFDYLSLGPVKDFFLIAGPCVVENETMPGEIAIRIHTMCKRLGIPYIFKASYRKANRSRSDSFTGIGDQTALALIGDIGKKLGIPVTTDIHSAAEAERAAEFVDILQIPAFLCRQSDLLEAAAATGKVVNVKKGQFLSPESMAHVVTKLNEAGNRKVWLTERGTTFGYQDLVVDFRGIPVMKKLAPVVMDCTHSLQQPNQPGGVTGGRPELIETMAKCAIAAGVDGLFIETHPDPGQARSDGANMLRIELLEGLLERVLNISKATRS